MAQETYVLNGTTYQVGRTFIGEKKIPEIIGNELIFAQKQTISFDLAANQ